jgi:hypothetical protein
MRRLLISPKSRLLKSDIILEFGKPVQLVEQFIRFKVFVGTHIWKKLGVKFQFDKSRMCEMNIGFRMISPERKDIKQSAGLYGQLTEIAGLPALQNSSNLSWESRSRQILSRDVGLVQVSKLKVQDGTILIYQGKKSTQAGWAVTI